MMKPNDAPARLGLGLRPATAEDIAEIVRIERAVHAAPWTKDNVAAEMDKPYARLLVLTDDETDTQVGAYIAYWVMMEECHILNVAVDPRFRRQGLAKMLVRTAAGEAMKKEIPKVLLDVRKGNEAAVALYSGLGFVVTHIRKTFYSNGEDAFQMALYLNEADARMMDSDDLDF